jgi:ribosomal protein L37AE/L43A
MTPNPYLIQTRALYHCPCCKQPVQSVFRPPSNTQNWLLFTIALILTPFLIGIVLWIVYYFQVKRENQTTYWHCPSCGWHAPAAAPQHSIAAPRPPEHIPAYQPVARKQLGPGKAASNKAAIWVVLALMIAPFALGAIMIIIRDQEIAAEVSKTPPVKTEIEMPTTRWDTMMKWRTANTTWPLATKCIDPACHEVRVESGKSGFSRAVFEDQVVGISSLKNLGSQDFRKIVLVSGGKQQVINPVEYYLK